MLSLFFRSYSQKLNWLKGLGGINNDVAYAITVDTFGNVYTTGSFEDKADFDPDTNNYYLTSNGSQGIYISKLDTSGNFVWAKSMGGNSNDLGYSITVDIFGNIYTTGWFQNTIDFDPGANTHNLTSEGNYDIFISKLNSSGNFIWAKTIGGMSDDFGSKIITDQFGNIYIIGYYRGNVDFNPGIESYYLNSTGTSDIFILKLDSQGNFIWSKSFGGLHIDSGRSIAIDKSGNIYATGTFNETADFDPSNSMYNLTSKGNADIFIFKLDYSGNFIWAKSIGGLSIDVGNSIVVDTSGSVYTTGYFYGTVDFNPNIGSYNLTSNGSDDIFILKLDDDGNFVWAKAIGSSNSDNSFALTLDLSGNSYTTGFFQGITYFDSNDSSNYLKSIGISDAFILKLDTNGNFTWVRSIGGKGGENGFGIALDLKGNIYTTGNFFSKAEYEPGSGSALLNSAGGVDVFVLKLNDGVTTNNENVLINSDVFSIYPNPSVNVININVNQDLLGFSYIITNETGKQLKKGKLMNSITQLDISQLMPSIYFIQIGEYRKKLIKVAK